MANLKVINTDTGEVKSDIFPGDRIVRKKSIDYLASTVEVNKDEPFIKVYTKTMFTLAQSLSGTENQFINYLLQYISYTSYVLANPDGKPLRRADIVKETGLKECWVDRVLESLVNKQVLAKTRTGGDLQFYANPYLFGKGKRVNSTIAKMFSNTRWAKMYWT